MGPPKCWAPGNCPVCPPLEPALSIIFCLFTLKRRVYFKIVGLNLHHLNSVFGPEVIGGLDTIRSLWSFYELCVVFPSLFVHVLFYCYFYLLLLFLLLFIYNIYLYFNYFNI